MAHTAAFSRMICALQSARRANIEAAGEPLAVTQEAFSAARSSAPASTLPTSSKKAGIWADVYEAGARVGGRVLTHTGLVGKGLTIELGAEFINSDHLDMYLGARPDVTLYPSNRRR